MLGTVALDFGQRAGRVTTIAAGQACADTCADDRNAVNATGWEAPPGVLPAMRSGHKQQPEPSPMAASMPAARRTQSGPDGAQNRAIA